MFAAIITVFLYALSGISNQRVAMRLGAMNGNLIRLSISSAILAVIVLLFYPESLKIPTFSWYFLSGVIGFGVGDIALFLSLERIGSRLAILLTLCLAPLFAIVFEWVWLGTSISAPVFAATSAILIGVAMALRPGTGTVKTERRGSPLIGVIAGIVSGFGQGSGAVISRRAVEVQNALGIDINGLSAAFQRVVAGLAFVIIVVIFLRIFYPNRRKISIDSECVKTPLKRFIPWIIASATFGPIIGVSCFQWALKTESSGIVLAIVSMTPIVMIPLTAITEKDRPTRLAIFGALIAVAGVIVLNLVIK